MQVIDLNLGDYIAINVSSIERSYTKGTLLAVPSETISVQNLSPEFPIQVSLAGIAGVSFAPSDFTIQPTQTISVVVNFDVAQLETLGDGINSITAKLNISSNSVIATEVPQPPAPAPVVYPPEPVIDPPEYVEPELPPETWEVVPIIPPTDTIPWIPDFPPILPDPLIPDLPIGFRPGDPTPTTPTPLPPPNPLPEGGDIFNNDPPARPGDFPYVPTVPEPELPQFPPVDEPVNSGGDLLDDPSQGRDQPDSGTGTFPQDNIGPITPVFDPPVYDGATYYNPGTDQFDSQRGTFTFEDGA